MITAPNITRRICYVALNRTMPCAVAQWLINQNDTGAASTVLFTDELRDSINLLVTDFLLRNCPLPMGPPIVTFSLAWRHLPWHFSSQPKTVVGAVSFYAVPALRRIAVVPISWQLANARRAISGAAYVFLLRVLTPSSFDRACSTIPIN